MDFVVCSQCGKQIEGKGIHFRKKHFCSDECCEVFDSEFAAAGEPDALDLDEDLEEDLEEDLGYRAGADDDETLIEDEFDIRPEDF